MSVLTGNPELVEQPMVRGRNAQTGNYIERIWKGTEDAAQAGLDELVGFDNAEVTGDGAVYTLRARYAVDPIDPQQEVPVHEERLHYNRVSKSILESPVLALSALTVEVLHQADVENRKLNDADIAFIEALPPDERDAAYAAFSLMQYGVTSFIVNQPVVIVTDTASSNFPWDIGFDNVGSVFSTDAMIADADLSSTWADNLPDDTAPSGFVFGWLKGPPEVSTTGGNRSQLAQEYEYGLWPEALFEQVT